MNNEYVDFFDIGVPIIIENVVPRPDSDYEHIQICINDNEDCCLEFEFIEPNCPEEEECAIIFIEEEFLGCNDDNSAYSMEINYSVTNTNQDLIDLWVNNESIGTYEIGEEIIIENITPNDNNAQEQITICVNDTPDCCYEYFFNLPPCIEPLTNTSEEEQEVFEITTIGKTISIKTKNNERVENVSLYNLNGQLITSKNDYHINQNLEISDEIIEGLYIVHVKTAKSDYSKIIALF